MKHSHKVTKMGLLIKSIITWLSMLSKRSLS